MLDRFLRRLRQSHRLTPPCQLRISKQLLILAAVLSTLLARSAIARAAPVTFMFEADVASVDLIRGGAALPFSVSIGDTVSTTFTFETTGGSFNDLTKATSYVQPHGINYEINGFLLTASPYTIFVRDNSPFGVPAAGSISNPTVLIGDDDQGPSGPSDDIAIRSGSNPLPTNESVYWIDSVALAGEGVLASDELTVAPNAWNAFSFREMSLVFVNAQSGGETYVGASVGTAVQIPEPTTTYLTALAFAGLLLISLRAKCMSCLLLSTLPSPGANPVNPLRRLLCHAWTHRLS